MKKIISILLAGVMICGVFAGCKDKNSTSGSLDLSQTIATVDGTEVKASTYYYTLNSLINSIVSNYKTQYNQVVNFSDIADQQYSETQTLGEYVEQYAYNMAIQSTIVNNYFKDQGYVLSSDEEAQYNKTLEERYSEAGGEDKYDDMMKTYGLSVDDDKEYVLTSTKYNILTTKLFGKGAADEITEDVAMQDFRDSAVRVKHILVKTVDESNAALTGDALTTAENKYSEVKAKVDALAAGDQAGFDALVKEYNEDTGMDENGYVIDENTSFVQEFKDVALKLGIGEIGTCDSTYGHHIIRRYDLRDEDLSAFLSLNYQSTDVADISAYVTQLQNDKFAEFINNLTNNADVKITNQDLIDTMNNKAVKGL